MKKDRFELYIPTHLRQLSLEIERFKEMKRLKPKGFTKRLKNIFDK
jgi:hypothetical protein